MHDDKGVWRITAALCKEDDVELPLHSVSGLSMQLSVVQGSDTIVLGSETIGPATYRPPRDLKGLFLAGCHICGLVSVFLRQGLPGGFSFGFFKGCVVDRALAGSPNAGQLVPPDLAAPPLAPKTQKMQK